jgi:hypothetical protein
LGCFEQGNSQNYPAGQCQEAVVQALVDFCGTCNGDNLACFFADTTAAVAGGIAGGVVAAIVIAAVVAALLAAFLSKKGYDYYQANSAMAQSGLHNNPAFSPNSAGQGAMPE